MPADASDLENRLLQNGCVVLYYSPFLLEEHTTQLVAAGWRYAQVYAGKEGTPQEFFDHLSVALEFPAYFGRNLAALNDCLGDIDFPASGKLAIGMECFEHLARHDPKFAHAVLDIAAGLERSFLLEGKRMLVLVQSNDPDLHFAPVGGFPVAWNFEEWLDSKRKKRNA